jgi:hypothetical protein
MNVGLPAATIIASSSHSACNACGGGGVLTEKKHITQPSFGGRPGSGCGIEFAHISTRSSLAKAKDAVRALRPDLEFIEFPRNGPVRAGRGL